MPQTSISPKTAALCLKRATRLRPALGIVLGSGFQHALDRMRIEREISFKKIPGFVPAGVDGHAGNLYFGRLGGAPAAVLSGRIHYYEGHEMEQVTFAVRTLAAFGIKDLLLTNAAGGINRAFSTLR